MNKLKKTLLDLILSIKWSKIPNILTNHYSPLFLVFRVSISLCKASSMSRCCCFMTEIWLSKSATFWWILDAFAFEWLFFWFSFLFCSNDNDWWLVNEEILCFRIEEKEFLWCSLLCFITSCSLILIVDGRTSDI